MTFSGACRGVVVGGLVLVLGVVAGCGGQDPQEETTIVTSVPSRSAEPTGEVSESADPSPSLTPGEVVVPVMPEAMANPDEAGARAAADYVLDLYSYTYWSGDVGPLQALCDPASAFCASVYDNVARRTANGEQYVGGDLTWAEEPVVTTLEAEYPAYGVRGLVNESSNGFVNLAGEMVEEYPEVISDSDMIVTFAEGAWHLYDLQHYGTVEP